MGSGQTRGWQWTWRPLKALKFEFYSWDQRAAGSAGLQMMKLKLGLMKLGFHWQGMNSGPF